MERIKKVVLAYSGGLDTSIIIPWLKENYDGCEVIAVAADVGQGKELSGLREKAIKTGASKIYIEDLRDEFVNDFVFPTLKAGRFMKTNTCSVLHLHDRLSQSVLWKSQLPKVRTRLHMDAPARATTRYGLSWQ